MVTNQMEFCEKCGSSRTKIDKEKNHIICQKCGYKKKIEGDEYKQKFPLINNKKNNDEKIVVFNKDYLQSKYKVSHKCPYCGNEEAYVQHIPPRWGDEEQLTIYTCTKCNKSDREGFSY